MTPYWQSDDGRHTLYHGDCLAWLATVEDASIDLAVVDPPYYRVKGDWWDRQWDTPDGFLVWVDRLCEQWQRVLKPNGSLYCFASPKMSARVECAIAERFNVLNRIRWAKPAYSTKAEMFDKDTMRAFFPASEEIVFAEQQGQELTEGDRPVWSRAIEAVRIRAGLSRQDVSEFVVGTRSGACWNWEAGIRFPDDQHWDKLCHCLPGLLLRDDAVPEWDGPQLQRREIRRPFFASPDAPYTDVWEFPTVQAYPGKHPCEKPQELIRHIIRTSSRPDALVLDCTGGSGSTAVAAKALGRRSVTCEIEEKWCRRARRNIEAGAMIGLPAGMVDGDAKRLPRAAPEDQLALTL